MGPGFLKIQAPGHTKEPKKQGSPGRKFTQKGSERGPGFSEIHARGHPNEPKEPREQNYAEEWFHPDSRKSKPHGRSPGHKEPKEEKYTKK